MMRVFIGWDSRQPLAYNVAQHAIHTHAGGRVIVEPLMIDKLPITRRGLTEFTYSRFLVPWLCDYDGPALFMDSDTVARVDLARLFECYDPDVSVQVDMTQVPFERPSIMLFNCKRCEVLTPAYVDDRTNGLLDLEWANVGSFPPDFNFCVGTDLVTEKETRILHYTRGVPCWEETQMFDRLDKAWLDARDDMNRTVDWRTLMGGSVHAKPTMRLFLKYKYGLEVG